MALKGIDFIIEVNTGTEASPVWTAIAGQRGGSFNGSGDTMDSTSKDGSGWEENIVGLRSWSIDFDGLHSETDVGLQKVFDEWIAGNQVHVRMKFPSGTTYEGDATITDISIDAPHDDVATATGSLEGSGAITKV